MSPRPGSIGSLFHLPGIFVLAFRIGIILPTSITIGWPEVAPDNNFYTGQSSSRNASIRIECHHFFFSFEIGHISQAERLLSNTGGHPKSWLAFGR
jgi:hypothetical protein